MKKYLILIGAAVMALSCTKELADPQDVMENTEYKTIKFESVITKTTVDQEGNVAWEAGDEITLYYIVDEEVKTAAATADAAGSSATFTAQIPVGDNPVEYYAAYPAGSGSLTAEGAFSINVDASKCDGTFKKANFAAAYSTAGAMSFQFKNAVGMLKVKLPEGGVIVRAKNNAEYPVTGVYVRGYKAGEALNGTIAVNVTDGAVSGFGVSGGPQNVNMPTLSSEAIASGYAYVPCTPATLTGLCVMFYSSEGYVPAVLSPETLTVTLERGHITPLADLSSKIVFDYWVSATGTGEGLTSTDPMSVEKMVGMMPSSSSLQADVYHLRGATFNFTEGTHSIEKTITIPAYTGSLGYIAQIDGNGKAVLEGASVKVFDVKGNAVISNLTIQGTDVSTLSGAAANGAAITVNPKTIVTLDNLTIQGNKAKSGGAVFVSYSNTCTDQNSLLDCVRCKFISNTATAQGGAIIVTSNATTGGVVRLNECYFEKNNSTSEGGAVVPNGKILMMFNKCSFFENKSSKGARDIYAVATASRLALNNCTLRGSSAGTSISSGSSMTTKCLSIVSNSTFWGNIGAWGCVALGSSTENGSLLVNNVINNRTATKPGLYFASSYYQNVQYCIYTGTAEHDTNGSDKVSVSDSKNLGLGGVFTGAKSPSVTDPYTYYYFTWDWDPSYPCPTLQEVRDAISKNPIGGTFLDWLDNLEEGGALSTDIAGNKRPATAMCPGSYQQTGVVANNN